MEGQEVRLSRPTVLVVDDEEVVSRTAKSILSADFRVVNVFSGEEALKFVTIVKPDLILLDYLMPGMDGFEVLHALKSGPETREIPVVIMTGSDDTGTEVKGFAEGASDFIRKPFLAEVLRQRVSRIVQLHRLQRGLRAEVDRQTSKIKELTREIMVSLSKAVDAKDHYTSGHSSRVALYSMEIAKRLGMSQQEQEDIFAMGLLHDIGKIGISEAIINKTSRLTDEEYMEIRKHPVIGHDILKSITQLPGLALGARWHHERFDGRGYPDGLKGEEIPLEARIIGVADAYDAMTSNRAYSNIRPQETVRAEIIRCRGTQFDPHIADVMVALIDDDHEYRMREFPKPEGDK